MPLTQLESPTHMLREIFSQPECWSECIRQLENDAVLHEIAANVPADSEWLFVGCGTSYYLALSAAASFSAHHRDACAGHPGLRGVALSAYCVGGPPRHRSGVDFAVGADD
jgi:hypothetical protein